MTLGDCPPPKATYVADGTGRDTYIRRDPVEQQSSSCLRVDASCPGRAIPLHALTRPPRRAPLLTTPEELKQGIL